MSIDAERLVVEPLLISPSSHGSSSSPIITAVPIFRKRRNFSRDAGQRPDAIYPAAGLSQIEQRWKDARERR